MLTPRNLPLPTRVTVLNVIVLKSKGTGLHISEINRQILSLAYRLSGNSR